MKEKQKNIEPLAVGTEEAAMLLSISRPQIYKMLASREIASFHIGTRRLIPVDTIREYIRSKIAEEKK